MPARILLIFFAVVIASGAAVFAVGSKPGSDTTPAQKDDTASPSDAAVGMELPAPSGRVVLTIKGVENGNVGAHTTEIDYATLDRAASEEMTIFEPFLKKDVEFKVISIAELFAAAGIPAGADLVYMHALDGYHLTLSRKDLVSEGFLAVRADGKRMPIADGGPVRVVFSDNGGLGANNDNWIWSLDRMKARG